jgi:hypothetical protein
MLAETSSNLNLAVNGSPKSDSVSEALKDFEGVQSRAFRWVLRWLPWIILALLVIVGLIVLKLRDLMFVSGAIAAVLSLFAFQVLMRRIPETLGAVWNRELVDVQDAADEEGGAASLPALEERYAAFVADTQALLNHPGQWGTAALFVLLVGTWTFLSRSEVATMTNIVRSLLYRRGFTPQTVSMPIVLLLVLVIGLEAFTGLILGLMAWRMGVLGVQVWRLGKRFMLVPQLGHPDQCGGFEPVGYLCLWNALILTIPAVYLGGWIILGPDTPYGRFVPLFNQLLLVPVAIAVSSFTLPLWGVHREMVHQRAAVRRRLDQLSQSINHLAREMLDRADELPPDEGEKMSRKLELMRQIYQQNEHYPVWPFNVGIMVRFLSSQAVPILGLTGLGKDIVGAIGALLGFLAQSNK